MQIEKGKTTGARPQANIYTPLPHTFIGKPTKSIFLNSEPQWLLLKKFRHFSWILREMRDHVLLQTQVLAGNPGCVVCLWKLTTRWLIHKDHYGCGFISCTMGNVQFIINQLALKSFNYKWIYKSNFIAWRLKMIIGWSIEQLVMFSLFKLVWS